MIKCLINSGRGAAGPLFRGPMTAFFFMPSACPLPSLVLPRQPPPSRQRMLFCACGSFPLFCADLCARCYRARAHSRSRFAGQREQVLARDRYRCHACGAGKAARRLHVHHRRPGVHDPDWLVSLCAACHARVHRLAALRRWLPERLIALWSEQHPEAPVQLQFPWLIVAGEPERAA